MRALEPSRTPTLSAAPPQRAPKYRSPFAEGDLPGLLRHVDRVGQAPEVRVERLGEVGGVPLTKLTLPCTARRPRWRVLVTAGVHGNEPSGPAAALTLLELLRKDAPARERLELTVLPLLNPTGFAADRRLTRQGVDLNRWVRAGDEVPPEVRVWRGVLDDGPYDLALDLHASKGEGALRRGFFAIFPCADRLASRALDVFDRHHPTMIGTTRLYRMLKPGMYVSRNEGTVKDYLASRGTRRAFTLEAPAGYTYEAEIAGLVDLCRALIGARLGAYGARA